MLIFPLLDSGAVAQYPLPLTFQGSAQVISFIDGADQRFIRQAKALRAWEIQLSVLTDSEIQQVESFFLALDGQYQTFSFPDPYSSSTVSNCRLGGPDLVNTYSGVDINSTSIWVVETNG
jgi:hypothetical protein